LERSARLGPGRRVPRDGEKHDGDDRRGETVLDVHVRRAGFEPGKNARQRARRHEPVNDRDPANAKPKTIARVRMFELLLGKVGGAE
jgi:hypothetical protein